MIINRRGIGILFYAVFFISLFTPGAYRLEAKESAKKITIGISLPTQREEHWVRDAKKMQEIAKEQNVKTLLQICDNDAVKQMSQCENLLAAGIDILILAPHDATSAASIVDKAHQAGVKVISYDRLVLNCDVDLYMSVDNLDVGRLQGAYLINKVPKGNYILFGGAPTDNCAKLFKQGAMEVIQPLIDKGDIKVVMDQWIIDWQPTAAMNFVENALTATNNKVDAVLAPNDNTAGGVIQALAENGLAGKVVVTGQDSELTAARRIVEGTQSMTIFKNSEKVAEETILTAIKMAKGEKPDISSKVNNNKIDVPAILFKPVVVDKNNIDAVLIDSGFLKRSDVYR